MPAPVSLVPAYETELSTTDEPRARQVLNSVADLRDARTSSQESRPGQSRSPVSASSKPDTAPECCTAWPLDAPQGSCAESRCAPHGPQCSCCNRCLWGTAQGSTAHEGKPLETCNPEPRRGHRCTRSPSRPAERSRGLRPPEHAYSPREWLPKQHRRESTGPNRVGQRH
jgi:hypothetical protein